MKVGIVTVTYGNRIKYVTKLIQSQNNASINKICVVVNGCSKDLFENLLKIKKVKFIFNPSNLGSAKGFKQGISYLKTQSNINFLWLLDDDNLPENNALEKIIYFYKNCQFNCEKDALLSYRPDRSIYLEAVKSNNGSLMLKGNNSALGFSLFANNKQFNDYQKKGLKVAPYGGLFFNKRLIDSIGYPDEKYFLYADDYDFTIRISENGGNIKLVKDSVITDLETSFHLKNNKNIAILKTRYHNTDNLDRIFYSVRNGIIFELKHMVDNKIVYYSNLSIYSLIIGILLVLYPKKFFTFYKGVMLGIINKKNG